MKFKEVVIESVNMNWIRPLQPINSFSSRVPVGFYGNKVKEEVELITDNGILKIHSDQMKITSTAENINPVSYKGKLKYNKKARKAIKMLNTVLKEYGLEIRRLK